MSLSISLTQLAVGHCIYNGTISFFIWELKYFILMIIFLSFVTIPLLMVQESNFRQSFFRFFSGFISFIRPVQFFFTFIRFQLNVNNYYTFSWKQWVEWGKSLSSMVNAMSWVGQEFEQHG